MRRNFMLACVLIVAVAMLPCISLAAKGIYWESEQTSTGMPGNKGGTNTIKTYQTAEAYRMDTDESITIFKICRG